VTTQVHHDGQCFNVANSHSLRDPTLRYDWFYGHFCGQKKKVGPLFHRQFTLAGMRMVSNRPDLPFRKAASLSAISVPFLAPPGIKQNWLVCHFLSWFNINRVPLNNRHTKSSDKPDQIHTSAHVAFWKIEMKYENDLKIPYRRISLSTLSRYNKPHFSLLEWSLELRL
jgi:hypothetical protein